jgi:hypothetical protein
MFYFIIEHDLALTIDRQTVNMVYNIQIDKHFTHHTNEDTEHG